MMIQLKRRLQLIPVLPLKKRKTLELARLLGLDHADGLGWDLLEVLF